MDLSKLNEAEKQAHYESVCASVGLDPKLGLLEYMWLDSGDSGRKLVLYALRGATDMLRSIHKINITKLTKDSGDGYISYIAEGCDAKGRTEMSVGACSVKGLSGKSLEVAVMTAQTRAMRRLTLQFIGNGILDESEVVPVSVTADISQTSVPLATIAQPTVKPSSRVGSDVTKPDIKADIKADPDAKFLCPKDALTIVVDELVEQCAKELMPDIKADIKPDPKPEVKKRGHKPGRSISLNSPGQVSEVPVVTPQAASVAAPEIVKAAMPILPVKALETPVIAKEQVVKPIPTGLPSKEQTVEFKARLKKYTDSILPNAGLFPSDNGIGINEKMRTLARRMFPGVDNMKHLTAEQWSQYLDYLDDKVEDEGAEELVKYIDSIVNLSL